MYINRVVGFSSLVIDRLRMFMEIQMFIKTTEGTDARSKFVSSPEHCNEHFTLNIMYIGANYTKSKMTNTSRFYD